MFSIYSWWCLVHQIPSTVQYAQTSLIRSVRVSVGRSLGVDSYRANIQHVIQAVLHIPRTAGSRFRKYVKLHRRKRRRRRKDTAEYLKNGICMIYDHRQEWLRKWSEYMCVCVLWYTSVRYQQPLLSIEHKFFFSFNVLKVPSCIYVQRHCWTTSLFVGCMFAVVSAVLTDTLFPN